MIAGVFIVTIVFIKIINKLSELRIFMTASHYFYVEDYVSIISNAFWVIKNLPVAENVSVKDWKKGMRFFNIVTTEF